MSDSFSLECKLIKLFKSFGTQFNKSIISVCISCYFRDLRSIELKNIKGFILNIPLYFEIKWGALQFRHKRKHWTCVRKISNSYYNLDSRLKCPNVIGNELELVTFLKEQIENEDMELFLVMKKECAENETWMKASHVASTTTSGINIKPAIAPMAENESIHSEASVKSAE